MIVHAIMTLEDEDIINEHKIDVGIFVNINGIFLYAMHGPVFDY